MECSEIEVRRLKVHAWRTIRQGHARPGEFPSFVTVGDLRVMFPEPSENTIRNWLKAAMCESTGG